MSLYCAVDLHGDNGYKTQLANPAAMEQYNGLKNTDHETDAFFLTEMDRLGILPEGYSYPKEVRPVRDLLRRRLLLVGQRTARMFFWSREKRDGECSRAQTEGQT